MQDTLLLLIKFKVHGNLRFLSHAEMLKVLQRACVRAGMKPQYSQGFNPRPKLSLPLPRTVGIETDDDLFCLRVREDLNEAQIAPELSKQLPDGCELLEISVSRTKTLPQPSQATYVLKIKRECLDDRLKTRTENAMASRALEFKRQNMKSSGFKSVDVRPYLKSIELDGENIVVECEISPTGSIRVNEILEILGLDAEKLVAPIRRTKVKWKMSL